MTSRERLLAVLKGLSFLFAAAVAMRYLLYRIGLLRRYCREFEICGGQLPPVFPFDIGDVCFQNYCRLNTDTAKVVAREILIRESKGFSQNRFVRTITDIFDN